MSGSKTGSTSRFVETCSVLGVSHSTVTRLLKHKHEKAEAKPETCGGDQKPKLYGHKRAAVGGFIKKLRARESHYSIGRKRRNSSEQSSRAFEADVQLGSPD